MPHTVLYITAPPRGGISGGYRGSYINLKDKTAIMTRLQDQFPYYDQTLLGLNNQYIAIGNDSFLINSPAVIADQHIVKTGCSYILVWSEVEKMYVHHVQLADVYHDNEKVNLLLKEISTNHTEKLELYLDMEHQSTWVLIDMEYIKNQVDDMLVKDFCGC